MRKFIGLRMGEVRANRLIVCVVLILFPIISNGQGFGFLGIPLDTLFRTRTPRVDRAYITTYYRQLHLYAVSDRQEYSMKVMGKSYSLNYKPNLPWALGLGVNYKWIGTELTIKLPFFGYTPERRGKTKPFGVTINLNNRRFWFSTQYQFYRGFYLSNPDVLRADWFDHSSAYPYRNDIRSQTVTSRLLYQFNPLRLSIPATLLQREEQRRGARSWNIGGSFAYQYIRADSSLVPSVLVADFRPESRLLSHQSVSLGLDVGYTQTIILHKHYFVNFTVRPGLTVLFQQTKTESNESENQLQAGWQGIASVTLGYSSASYYGGIYASTTKVNRTFFNGLINTDSDYVKLVFGKRIRYKPKGLIKQVPGL